MFSCFNFLWEPNPIIYSPEEKFFNYIKVGSIFVSPLNAEYLAYVILLACYETDFPHNSIHIDKLKELISDIIAINNKKIYVDLLHGLDHVLDGRPSEYKIGLKQIVGRYSNSVKLSLEDQIKDAVMAHRGVLLGPL